MASLRFKKDGTPFVDFRAYGKRYRPEFLRVKDAQSFMNLADASAEEAYAFWQASIQQPAVEVKKQEIVSLKEKVESFKTDYCSKRANERDMRRVMTEFLDFILERKGSPDIDIKDVSLEDLSAFQSHLKSRGIENASVNRYFTTVKAFFRRAQKALYVTVNYAPLVESLSVDHVQREVWTDEDTPKLIAHLVKHEQDQGLIDLAKSMEFTPFGPTDFKRLKWRMIDLHHGFVRTYRVKGKGRRDWNVPIVLGYQKLLLEIRNRQAAMGSGGPDDYVYLTSEKKPIKPGAISKSLERARKAVGIKAVPYTSRHRVITLVNNKADLKTASMFAGHASTKTTERHYVVEGDEDFQNKVREAFRK